MLRYGRESISTQAGQAWFLHVILQASNLEHFPSSTAIPKGSPNNVIKRMPKLPGVDKRGCPKKKQGGSPKTPKKGSPNT